MPPHIAAFDRPWTVPEVVNLNAFPALVAARRFSCELLVRMRERLTELPPESHVLCVAVSGSLGRLEAGPLSDADVIVIASEAAARHSAVQAVWERLAPLSLPPPLTNGIFATATTPPQLLDPTTRGQIADDVQIFGTRMQLLLDSQPVFGAQRHHELLAAIVARWSAWGTSDLRDDLIRYYRALCLDARWDFGLYDGGWYVHELKLRFSRRLIYAGLLLQLGVGPDLAERLHLTPLERIADVYRHYGDSNFPRIAESYDAFLSAINDPVVRAAWQASAPRGFDEHPPTSPASFAALDVQAQKLSRELWRFTLERRQDWGEDFLAELLF